MTEIEIQEQVSAFVALPRAERRAAYNALPLEVRAAARAAVEARRGIEKRVDGKIVHTKDVYVAQIVRLALKELDYKKRIEKLPKRLASLKAALSAHYGEEALAAAENAAAEALAAVNG